MTSKLKCPFCGEELSPSYGYGIEVYMCPNLTCHKAPGYAEDGVWQALIQAKQDLETAKADIEDYKKYKALWEQIRNNTILELERKLEIATKALKEIQTAQGRCWGATDTEIKNDCKYYAYKALEQIEHKVKDNE